MRASARRCGIAAGTAFRRRHRFLEAVNKTPQKLKGIVEADETCVPQSLKGERNSERKQVPVLIAAYRGGLTASAVLEKANAKTPHQALEPVAEKDIPPPPALCRSARRAAT